MKTILRVGDPHVTVRNIPDCEKLIDFILDQAKQYDVDRIEFMGDLFHTHAVIRIEVLDFWRKSFRKLVLEGFKVTTLVGNHDQPGSKEKEQEMNALQVLAGDGVLVVDKPVIEDNMAYVPYMSNIGDFLEACKKLHSCGAKCLIAHQTFTGAQYENGFYAEDGIDPDLLDFDQIISGHIHKEQFVGKCHYIGTPKWDSMSDANQAKGIWIFEHSEDGLRTSARQISTEDIVTPIIKHVITEGEEVPELKANARIYLEFHGKTAWISKMKKKYKGKASIKGKPTDRRVQKLEAEKTLTLQDFLENQFEPIDKVSKKDINAYLKEIHESSQAN